MLELLSLFQIDNLKLFQVIVTIRNHQVHLRKKGRISINLIFLITFCEPGQNLCIFCWQVFKELFVVTQVRRNNKTVWYFNLFIQEFSQKFPDNFWKITIITLFETAIRTRVGYNSTSIKEMTKLPDSLGVEVVSVDWLSLFIIKATRNKAAVIVDIFTNDLIILKVANHSNKTLWSKFNLGITLVLALNHNCKWCVDKCSPFWPFQVCHLKVSHFFISNTLNQIKNSCVSNF